MNKQSYLFDKNANPNSTPWLSPAYGVGDLIFLSGQMSFDEQMNIVGETIEEQTTCTLESIRRVLSQLDMGLDDIVKTTVWLSRRSDFKGFNKVYSSAFDCAPPARSTVISDLVFEKALLEIEVVAAQRSIG